MLTVNLYFERFLCSHSLMDYDQAFCRATIASVPMKQRIRENETEEQIDTFCDSQGWKHEYSGNAYYIETPVAK